MQMIRSVLLVSRGQNENILIAIVWGDGRPTRVSTAGHLNKVAFLKAIREKLNMRKPNKMGHHNKVAFLNAIREELNMPKPNKMGHQNKVEFLNAIRKELNMPKLKKSKSKPKGVQFRRSAKKRESVKGVLAIYIYLTIWQIWHSNY